MLPASFAKKSAGNHRLLQKSQLCALEGCTFMNHVLRAIPLGHALPGVGHCA